MDLINYYLQCYYLLNDLCFSLYLFRQDWAPLLNSYRVESAWKLGNWSCLDQTLKQVNYASTVHVNYVDPLMSVIIVLHVHAVYDVHVQYVNGLMYMYMDTNISL